MSFIMDPYKLMGLDINDPKLTKKDVVKRYYTIALLVHPDKGGSAEEMKILQAAYEQVKNEVDKLKTLDDATIDNQKDDFTHFLQEQLKDGNVNVKSFDEVFKEYMASSESTSVAKEYEAKKHETKHEAKHEANYDANHDVNIDVLPQYNPDVPTVPNATDICDGCNEEVRYCKCEEHEPIECGYKEECIEPIDIKEKEPDKKEKKDKKKDTPGTGELVQYGAGLTRVGNLNFMDIMEAFKKPAMIDLSTIEEPIESLDELLVAKLAERNQLNIGLNDLNHNGPIINNNEDVHTQETLFNRIKHMVRKKN